LFMSIRSAASCCHPLQESVVPRAARTVLETDRAMVITVNREP
jgi:3-polyprenyl-4-hydroxybenzoate decarboxylase